MAIKSKPVKLPGHPINLRTVARLARIQISIGSDFETKFQSHLERNPVAQARYILALLEVGADLQIIRDQFVETQEISFGRVNSLIDVSKNTGIHWAGNNFDSEDTVEIMNLLTDGIRAITLAVTDFRIRHEAEKFFTSKAKTPSPGSDV